MATLTFAYVSKCNAADPHVYLRPEINGQAQDYLAFLLSDLTGPFPDHLDRNQAMIVLVRNFCREWRLANPAGTLPQLRAALEARTWEV